MYFAALSSVLEVITDFSWSAHDKMIQKINSLIRDASFFSNRFSCTMQVSFSFFYFSFLITVHVWGGLGNCVPRIQKEVSGHHGSQLCPPTVCTRNGTRIVRPRGKNFYVLSHLKDSRYHALLLFP